MPQLSEMTNNSSQFMYGSVLLNMVLNIIGDEEMWTNFIRVQNSVSLEGYISNSALRDFFYLNQDFVEQYS